MNPGDTCTPIYGLPYATGSSPPCNIGDTMCDFATAVETQLDLLDAAAARFQEPPFAYATNTTAQTYDNNLPSAFVLTFNTTLADTDNMIDTAFDPASIYIRTAGVYSFFVELDLLIASTGTSLTCRPKILDALGSQIGGNFDYQTFRFSAPSVMPTKNDGIKLANVCFTAEFIADVGVGYSYSNEITVGGTLGTISTTQTYRAGAIWLRDSL